MTAHVDLFLHATGTDVPAPRYPASQQVTLEQSKSWPENVRTIRTCQYCRKVYRHAGAAVTCEHSHRRGGAGPGASP